MTAEDKKIFEINTALFNRFKTWYSEDEYGRTVYHLYTNTDIMYVYDITKKEYYKVTPVKVDKVKSFLFFNTKLKDIKCDIKAKFKTVEDKEYYFYLNIIKSSASYDIPLPYKPFGYDASTTFQFTLCDIYREFLDQIFNEEKGVIPDSSTDPIWTDQPFTSYKYSLYWSLLMDNRNKIKIVNKKHISKYLLFRVIVDKRTETFKLEYPKKYNGVDFSKLSQYEIMVWMFKNCDYVPFSIHEETFEPNGKSHRWDHIEDNDEIMEKLKPYLDEVKHEPIYTVYYYIRTRRSNKKTKYYLERDIIMSPRPNNKKKKEKK